MAMGNYAGLALEFGGGTDNDGSLVGESGIRVALYKNWLYIYHEEAYRDEIPYTKAPLVGKVESGEMEYGDIEIHAERGPKGGVHAVLETGYRYTDDEPYHAIALIGVYGFYGEEWRGIPNESAKHLPEFVNERVEGLKWADFCPYDQDDHPYYTSSGTPKYREGTLRGESLMQGPRPWEIDDAARAEQI